MFEEQGNEKDHLRDTQAEKEKQGKATIRGPHADYEEADKHPSQPEQALKPHPKTGKDSDHDEESADKPEQ